MSRFRTIKLKRQDFKPELCVIGQTALLGLSSLFTQIAVAAVMTVPNNLLVKYGAISVYGADIPLATLGITMRTSQLITSIAMGIGVGIQPILGYNYGSGQYPRVKQAYRTALFSGTAVMIAAVFVFQVFPEAIISIFGQESELYVEFAVKCFRIYLMACFLVPSGMVTGVLFQSIGKPVPAMVPSLSRQIIFLIPAMFILGALTGVEGTLWAGPVSDTLAAVLSLLTLRGYWKKLLGGAENG